MVIITTKRERRIIMEALREYINKRTGPYSPSDAEASKKESDRWHAGDLVRSILELHDDRDD